MIAENKTGSLKVSIKSDESQYKIPKEIQVLKADLSLDSSRWIFDDEWTNTILPGIYIIRLNLTSGLQRYKVVEVEAGKEFVVNFNISSSSLTQQDETSAFLKADSYRHMVSNRKNKGTQKKFQQGVKDRHSGKISTQGHLFLLGSFEELCCMVVEGLDTKQYVVSLPPGNNIRCFLRLVEKEDGKGVSSELDISVSGSNFTAQALLSLISSGDIEKAGALFRSTEAENLLYGKLTDPVSAVIGGYYLLRTRELHRMHDWANNLANWFLWMPDGAIIHAWHLILQKNLNDDIIQEIRNRLVEAFKRGIPIYTEGLRLLYEGLNMCSYQFKKQDYFVEQILGIVKEWTAYADMSQETSTFIFPKNRAINR